jgi:predicted nuclease of restriction endonuclease-like (RecB) superfamily
VLPVGYAAFVDEIKDRIRSAQLRAVVAVNRELVLLYWHIGQEVLTRQRQQGWGAKVIDRLAADLRHAFPELKGFSARNLKYMRALAEAFPDELFVQQVVAQLPWGHLTNLLVKVSDSQERGWYIRETVEHGWSRAVLAHQIGTDLYRRQGRAVTNFARTLPPAQSESRSANAQRPVQLRILDAGRRRP